MPKKDPNWDDILPPYIRSLKAARRSERTIELRTYQVTRFAKATGLRPGEVTLDDLRIYIANPAWKPSTAQVAKSSLSGVFKFATEEKFVKKNPAERLLSPKINAGKPRPASDDAVAAALDAAAPRVREMVQLGARAGLRAIDIASVHTSHVEFGQGGATLRVLGKGNKERIIPIADDLAAMITTGRSGYIFPGRIDGHVSPAYVSRLVSQVLPPGVTAHKLRHRFATRAYRNSNHNLRAVQELLGHASVATTQVYAGVEGDELRQAALSASD